MPRGLGRRSKSGGRRFEIDAGGDPLGAAKSRVRDALAAALSSPRSVTFRGSGAAAALSPLRVEETLGAAGEGV